MGYQDDMNRCIEYIVSHLKEELEPKELAKQFGYSFYHFCRVFRSINGISVGKYIQQRRMEGAASELADGKSVTRTAMDWGFETPSGFYKAFSRQFGIPPSVYGNQKGMVKEMEMTIRNVESFRAIGYVFRPEKKVDIREDGAYWYGKDLFLTNGSMEASIGTMKADRTMSTIREREPLSIYRYQKSDIFHTGISRRESCKERSLCLSSLTESPA